MKKLFLLLFICLFAMAAAAQSPDVLKAKGILEKVATKTKTYTTIRASFSITLENLQTSETDSYPGKIVLKGSKYKTEIMNTETFFDGQTLWSYLPDANEVNIADSSMMESEMIDPATVFTIYEQDFKYIYAGETTINSKKVDIVDLFPQNRNKSYSRIKLYIYRDTLQFARLSQIGKDGNNYTVDITKMEVNTPAADSEFTFDASAHPDVEIIDMR